MALTVAEVVGQFKADGWSHLVLTAGSQQPRTLAMNGKRAESDRVQFLLRDSVLKSQTRWSALSTSEVFWANRFVAIAIFAIAFQYRCSLAAVSIDEKL